MLQNVYDFCHFNEGSAIRKPKIIAFSITGPQIFFADFVVSTTQSDILHTGKPLTTLIISLYGN